ncbi:MAG TPA: hypothetical protein VNH13_10385 [Candidatus Acidoferrales bacterium]|jgi:hypothetical protein|nr:hypothetical protein [Candidatus Acidoferrales bacterium]
MIRRSVAVLLVALLVAACGPDAPGASPTPTPAPFPTPTVTLYGLNTTVWYAGLVLTFTTATAELDERGGTVALAGRVANPGTDDRTFNIPLRITAGAQGFELSRGQQVAPIPAGGLVAFALTFDVIGRSNVDDAILRVGPSTEHQALVPFESGTTPTVALQPVTLKVKGTANAADLRVVLRTGELRWDLPDWADELPNPSAAITLTYGATYRGTFQGGLAFTGDNVSLQLPDGTVVEERADGRSQTIGLILPGRTLAATSRFEVPSGMTGRFVLIVRNGSAHATIAFTVPG